MVGEGQTNNTNGSVNPVSVNVDYMRVYKIQSKNDYEWNES